MDSSDGVGCVELDALSVPVLQELAKEHIERCMDMTAFNVVLEQDRNKRDTLQKILANN